MPVESQTRKNSRTVPREQDTFRYSTPDVRKVARPVDAYAAPYLNQTKGKQLLSILDDFDRTAGNLQETARRKEKADNEAGTLLAARGEAVPVDASAATIEGHEQFSGIASSGEYQALLDTQVFEAHKDSDPDEFREAISEATKKFMNGRSDAFVKGLAGQIPAIQEKQFLKYHTHQKQQLKGIGIEKINSTVAFTVGNLLEGAENAGELSLSFRGLLDDMQAIGKPYGLDRNEVTLMFTDYIGDIAVAKGIPELMEFARVKDSSKISAEDSIHGDRIRQYRTQAENARDAIERAKETALEKAQRQAREDRETAIARESFFGDPAKARKQLTMASVDGTLNGRDILFYGDFINKVQGRQGFARESNKALTLNLHNQARLGTLTLEGLAEHVDSLTYEDTAMVATSIISRREQERKRAESGGGESLPDQYKKEAFQLVEQLSSFDNQWIRDDLGKVRKERAVDLWFKAIEDFPNIGGNTEKEKREPTTRKDWMLIKNTVLEEAYEVYPHSNWKRRKKGGGDTNVPSAEDMMPAIPDLNERANALKARLRSN